MVPKKGLRKYETVVGRPCMPHLSIPGRLKGHEPLLLLRVFNLVEKGIDHAPPFPFKSEPVFPEQAVEPGMLCQGLLLRLFSFLLPLRRFHGLLALEELCQ